MLNYIVYLWVSNERELWREIHENINSGYLCLGVMNTFLNVLYFACFCVWMCLLVFFVVVVFVLFCFYGQQEVWFGLVWCGF